MNILVTGGSGFIGSHLVRHLLRQTQHRVLNIDKLTYAGSRNNLSDVEHNERYQFVCADICHTGAVSSAIESFTPQAIIHLAAESHVDRSIDGPAQFMQTNVMGTYVLLEAARRFYDALPALSQQDFRFVHVSTDEVYGDLDFAAPAFDEQSRYDPHSPYAASKAASDHLVRAWRRTYGLPTIVTNCSNNYGTHQYPEKFIPVVIRAAVENRSIPIYGDGTNVRDWIHVSDHVRALERVLTCGKVGATYNIGANNELSNLDLAREICEILDRLHDRTPSDSYSKLITLVADRPGHDLRYAINAAKTESELEWRPTVDFLSGLSETVRWYLT